MSAIVNNAPVITMMMMVHIHKMASASRRETDVLDHVPWSRVVTKDPAAVQVQPCALSSTDSCPAAPRRNCRFDPTESAAVTVSTVSTAGNGSTAPTVSCDRLLTPTDGTKSGDMSTTVGAVVTFACDARFRLTGSVRRECLASGAWSGSVTTCERESVCLRPRWSFSTTILIRRQSQTATVLLGHRTPSPSVSDRDVPSRPPYSVAVCL